MQFDYTKIVPVLIIAAITAVIYYIAIVKKNKSGGGGKSTPFLNLYTTDFTELARLGKIDPVVGREDEIRRLSQVLTRREKNNGILIGDPGVGKTAVVEALAARIVSGDVPDTLANKRVLALDVTTLMSGTKYRGEFEERAKKIINEISRSNRSIILFIDEVHSIVESQGTEGSINLSDILKPALARGDLQMIGATTFVEYEKYIKTDPSLERRFQTIEVQEPTPEQTLNILRGVKDKYREYHKVEFTDAALEVAVKLTDDLIKDRKFPDKAIDALDESAAMVKVGNIGVAALHQAAGIANPDAMAIWKKIQDLDEKILGDDGSKKTQMITEREKLEEDLATKGSVTVDSSDIEKIVKEWNK